MKIFRDDYTYGSEEEQYSDFRVSRSSSEQDQSVEAEYIRSAIAEENGKAFIEALPPAPTIKECLEHSCSPILSYNRDQKYLPKDLRVKMASTLLRQLRIPTDFQFSLEQEIQRTLHSSYLKRYQLYDPEADFSRSDYPSYKSTDRKGKLVAEDCGDATIGFTLTGRPGTGKSSALMTALKTIPPVITHSDIKSRITQIPVLVVVCPANSNMRGLLAAIGGAVDKALGNVSNGFQSLIEKKTDLDKRASIVASLIENYAIGLIIFDEIQQMDFSAISTKSFNYLVTISNRTKVGFGFVGTEEAKAKVCANEYINRRAGIIIDSGEFTGNREMFKHILSEIQKYSWTKQDFRFNTQIRKTASGKTRFEDELTERFYYYASGGIDRVISLYSYLQIELIQNEEKELDLKLLESLIDKKYPGLKQLLKRKGKKAIAEADQIFQKGNEPLSKLSTEDNAVVDETAAYKKLIAQSPDNRSAEEMRRNVLENVRKCFPDYTDEQLNDTYSEVMRYKKNQNKNETELTQEVVKRLMAKPKRKKVPKISPDDISADLSRAYAGGDVS